MAAFTPKNADPKILEDIFKGVNCSALLEWGKALEHPEIRKNLPEDCKEMLKGFVKEILKEFLAELKEHLTAHKDEVAIMKFLKMSQFISEKFPKTKFLFCWVEGDYFVMRIMPDDRKPPDVGTVKRFLYDTIVMAIINPAVTRVEDFKNYMKSLNTYIWTPKYSYCVVKSVKHGKYIKIPKNHEGTIQRRKRNADGKGGPPQKKQRVAAPTPPVKQGTNGQVTNVPVVACPDCVTCPACILKRMSASRI